MDLKLVLFSILPLPNIYLYQIPVPTFTAFFTGFSCRNQHEYQSLKNTINIRQAHCLPYAAKNSTEVIKFYFLRSEEFHIWENVEELVLQVDYVVVWFITLFICICHSSNNTLWRVYSLLKLCLIMIPGNTP